MLHLVEVGEFKKWGEQQAEKVNEISIFEEQMKLS